MVLQAPVVLITGAAGFVGYHTMKLAIENHYKVVGLDSFNSYYDVDLKKARVSALQRQLDHIEGKRKSKEKEPEAINAAKAAAKQAGKNIRHRGKRISEQKPGTEVLNKTFHLTKTFPLYDGDVCDRKFLKDIFQAFNVTHVLHLAAQAGVRYSLEAPQEYVRNNVECFVDLLEAIREENKRREPRMIVNKKEKMSKRTGELKRVEEEWEEEERHLQEILLVYASSSSVYGKNTKVPFAESDPVDSPASLYATTKRMNELTAKTYANLYEIQSVGLRFFTVYGTYGRPDMAYFDFVDKILNPKMKKNPIQIFHKGKASRDFTYVDDIVDGIYRSLEYITRKSENWCGPLPTPMFENMRIPPEDEHVQYCTTDPEVVQEVFNLGNSDPMSLMDFVKTIEAAVFASNGTTVNNTNVIGAPGVGDGEYEQELQALQDELQAMLDADEAEERQVGPIMRNGRPYYPSVAQQEKKEQRRKAEMELQQSKIKAKKKEYKQSLEKREKIYAKYNYTGKLNLKFAKKTAAKGDVLQTYADLKKSKKLLGYQPRTPLSFGLRVFVEWYKKVWMPMLEKKEKAAEEAKLLAGGEELRAENIKSDITATSTSSSGGKNASNAKNSAAAKKTDDGDKNGKGTEKKGTKNNDKEDGVKTSDKGTKSSKKKVTEDMKQKPAGGGKKKQDGKKARKEVPVEETIEIEDAEVDDDDDSEDSDL
ncbi:unnamed protein product [Amoebophrya sp. A120]|nr:unnamed protein product [Amoebophrya sp. A120]|eukprot:GSA120T00008679001.1